MNLVLLHGFTGRPESWDGVLAALPSHRAVCLPLGGHDPALLELTGGFAEELDRLEGELERLGLEEVHICGYSLGARLALGLLIRHPRRFARATLIGANPGLPDEVARAERRRADEHWRQILVERGLDDFAYAWEAQPLFDSEARLPNAVRALARATRRSHDAAGLARSLVALGLGAMPDWTPHLRQIAAPVHLVVGSDDPKFRALAGRMAESLPRSRITIVDGAGHNLPLERPRAVAAAIFNTEEIA